MYTSKYYTCEQIDQRLLQGYYDDAVAHGFTGNISEFWEKILSISGVITDLRGLKDNCDKFIRDIGNQANNNSTLITGLTERLSNLESAFSNTLNELSNMQPLTEQEIDTLVNGVLY